MVTTDSLARGIDVPGVECVILYDTPKFAKNYIHRIGRTGRAGREGTSLVLVTNDQVIRNSVYYFYFLNKNRYLIEMFQF